MGVINIFKTDRTKYTQTQCDRMHWNFMQRLYRRKVRAYFRINWTAIESAQIEKYGWFDRADMVQMVKEKMKAARNFQFDQLRLKMKQIDAEINKSIEAQLSKKGV